VSVERDPAVIAARLRANGVRVSFDRRRMFSEVLTSDIELVRVVENDPQRVMDVAVRMTPPPCAVVLADLRVFLLPRSPVARIAVQVVGGEVPVEQSRIVQELLSEFGYKPASVEPAPEPAPVKKTRKKKAAVPVEEEPLEPGEPVEDAPVAEPEPQPEGDTTE
jgi:hypothetical protein